MWIEKKENCKIDFFLDFVIKLHFLKMTINSMDSNFPFFPAGGIPYTAHGAQLPPPPLFLIFVYFLFLCLF